MTTLSMLRDGINAIDLGVVGECQYAVSVLPVGDSGILADIFRRNASYVGTYGGWRWECGSRHPEQYPNDPILLEVSERIQALAGHIPAEALSPSIAP